jgi:serine/threonine protein kinase
MDIKLENILIANDCQLKFCDFGFSLPKNSYVHKKMGTPIYMAPEIIISNSFPCKAYLTDIFSLGIVFFMLAFGAPPFHSAEFSDSYFSFIKLRPGNLDFFKYHPHTRSLYRDNKIPVSFQKMLIDMLMAEPSQRV